MQGTLNVRPQAHESPDIRRFTGLVPLYPFPDPNRPSMTDLTKDITDLKKDVLIIKEQLAKTQAFLDDMLRYAPGQPGAREAQSHFDTVK